MGGFISSRSLVCPNVSACFKIDDKTVYDEFAKALVAVLSGDRSQIPGQLQPAYDKVFDENSTESLDYAQIVANAAYLTLYNYFGPIGDPDERIRLYESELKEGMSILSLEKLKGRGVAQWREGNYCCMIAFNGEEKAFNFSTQTVKAWPIGT